MRVLASTFTAIAVLGLSLLDVVFAEQHATDSQPVWRRRHRVARSPVVVSGSSQNTTARSEDLQLERRIEDAKFSFYDAGLGACGKVNSGSDFIVALNIAQWDAGSHCFEMITISFGGKTTQAQITDQCPGCPFGGLDMSRGLFGFFSSLDAGIIHGTWNFGGGSAPPKDPPKQEEPPHTTTPKPKPTTTSTPPPPPPTTTSHKTTSTTSSTPPPTTSSTSSVAPTTSSKLSSSTTSSTSSTPTPTPGLMALGLLNQAYMQLGELIVAGAHDSTGN